MYSELDVHIETFMDRITDFINEDKEHYVLQEHVDHIDVPDAEHPTNIIEITQHDGRKFRTTITTQEVE